MAKKQNNQQTEAIFPVYNVTSNGTSVEFTPDFKSAEDAFKDSTGAVNLWSVEADGSAKLVKRK